MIETNIFNHIEETKKHKRKVDNYLNLISKLLEKRGKMHDDSKLENIEKEIFSIYSAKLKDTTYGSKEYINYLEEMKPALKHHYDNNNHHPEHFKNGLEDMDLIDLIEMLMDWLAASKRHNDGDIMKSIEFNENRFKYDKTLSKIFKNTIINLKNLGIEEVDNMLLEENEQVRSIVYDWMIGKTIGDDYKEKYKDDFEKANEVILTLCSMGLG